MVFFSENEDQSDNESLPPQQYQELFARYKELIEENQSELCTNNETEYLTIRNNPVVLNDPDDENYVQGPKVKFPYLRRGAGLARYNMTPEELKKGPPDLYKKREFKSFLNSPVNQPKNQKVTNVVKTQKPVARKCATNVVKVFDDEVIPTLRNNRPSGEAFEVPIPKIMLTRRDFEPKLPNLPKTPIKNLVLKQGVDQMPQNISNDDINITDDESDSSDDEKLDTSASRRLCYEEKESETIKRKDLTDHVKENINTECRQEEPQSRKFNSYQIAQAMKRKGLTDNVKKHLGWITPPKKRRPYSIVKKVKIKRPKPVKEKLTLHELKDRLQQLEDLKNKLQAENNHIKRMEKDYLDEKLKLDKQRRELENMIKDERESIAEERLKLIEDVKKLKREKAAFEKYCAETRNLPTREEREEIRTLKEELEKLKDLQKTKDSRVAALQAQLRNRIVVLEKENTVLKEDLEVAKKVSLKKVRFESEGRIRSKVINAINAQLDGKLKGKSMRRTKSATEFQPAEEVVEISPEVGSKDDADSGIGSRPSTGGSSGSLPQDETIQEIRKRLEKVLAASLGSDEILQSVHSSKSYSENSDNRPQTVHSSKFYSENSDNRPQTVHSSKFYSENADIRPQTAHSSRPYSDIPDIRRQSAHSSDMPDIRRNMHSSENPDNRFHSSKGYQEHSYGLAQNNPSSAYQEFQNFDKLRLLDITDDFNSFEHHVPKISPRVCSRHGVPAQDKSRLDIMSSSRFSDRHVIRTELGGGDIEEEELHTGVRRLWCGICGSCEVTYRNRIGYRRTTTTEGNTLEEHPDGTRECRFRSGEILRKFPNGDKELLFPNGDREFTTRGYKKLERPDGTVKTVFDDGRQETRYPDGRIRRKDKNGLLIMNTGGFDK